MTSLTRRRLFTAVPTLALASTTKAAPQTSQDGYSEKFVALAVLPELLRRYEAAHEALDAYLGAAGYEDEAEHEDEEGAPFDPEMASPVRTALFDEVSMATALVEVTTRSLMAASPVTVADCELQRLAVQSRDRRFRLGPDIDTPSYKGSIREANHQLIRQGVTSYPDRLRILRERWPDLIYI